MTHLPKNAHRVLFAQEPAGHCVKPYGCECAPEL